MTRKSVLHTLAALTFLLAPATLAHAAPPDSGPYQVDRVLKIGGEGRWDYVTYDPAAKLLYVPRSSHVMIIDPAASSGEGKVVADIPDTPGVHGVALAPDANRGFTSNGKDDTVTIFDLKTHKALGKVSVGKDPDCIIFDPSSQCAVAVCGDSGNAVFIPVGYDPTTPMVEKPIVPVDLGGKPEYAVADGMGHVYVNITDKNEVVTLDTTGVGHGKDAKITARWSLSPAQHPTGLALDPTTHRLFSACRNNTLAVSDPQAGKVVTTIPIGSGTDAAIFDAGLALASCGDGTVTVARGTSPNQFEVIQTLKTLAGARTMCVDPTTHTLYLPTADMEPPKDAKSRPTPVAGSFKIVVVKKILADDHHM